MFRSVLATGVAVMRLADRHWQSILVLLVLCCASPAQGQEGGCSLSNAATHLARIVHESDFGHPYYRQVPAPPTMELPDGAGIWFSFEGDGKPPLAVLLIPAGEGDCQRPTQSFCVHYSVEAVPDDDNLIEPLVANVHDVVRRKDHGEFAPPGPECGWVYLSQEQAPEAALSSASLDRTAHWLGFIFWGVAAVLGGFWFFAREGQPRLRRDAAVVHFFLLAGSALLLWVLAVLLWQETAFALLWLGLWALVAALCWQFRGTRQLWFPVGLVGITALILRVQAPHLPANWYVALQAPGGLPVADVVGGGGFAGLFRSLGFLLPVNSAWVFGWNVVASSATPMLFAGAGYRAVHVDGERRWPSWGPAAWGLLLALNPLLVRIGASDATHVTALFAAAIAAACYVEATRSKGVLWWLAALFAAVLVGWTRLEFAPFPLVLPLLFGTGTKARGHRWMWVSGFIGLAAAAALASFAKRSIHAEVTQMGTFQWTFEHVTSWFRILTLQFLRAHHLNQALYLLFVPFAGWVLWTKRITRFGPVLAFYVLVAPRVISAFHEPEIGWNLLIARYDLSIITVMCLWAAAGLFGIWTLLLEASLRLSKRTAISEKLANRGAIAVSLVVALSLFAWGRPTANIADDRYSFQHEYEFLDSQLSAMEAGTVIAIWQQGDRHERHDFDTGLAVPHPLLVMDHPGIRWVVVNEFQGLPEDVTEAFLFLGANTQLDIRLLAEMGAPDGARSVGKLKGLAEQLLPPDFTPAAAETHRPDVLQFPLVNGELRLNWYSWSRMK